MAYPHHGGQLQDRDAAATHRAEPCVAAPAGAATAKPCSRRVNAARRAISCFMAAMLVVTMNPVANHLSAFAAPSDAFGGGALNDVPAPQVGETDGSGQGQDAAAEAKEPGEEPDAGPADPAAESNDELAATETPNAAGNGASTAEDVAASEATQEDPAEDAAPSYTTWADVAEAVESGELSGEGFEPAGSGTAEDPYAVATPEAFAWWALLHADADARLDADLDLTERGGEPLPWPGDATLSGELDGAAHAVAFATEGAGLFAEVAAGGAVRWLKLGRTDSEARSAADAGDPVAEVASAAALAGSVAGVNKGEIEGVVNRMPVGFSAGAPADAERSAGGIVARNDGAIADCANLGAVSNDAAAGDSAAAGIAARGTGTVATSYNAGGVKAAQNAAYIMTLLDAEGDCASVVDEATCYLAPGEGAAYEGVSEAGQNRPGALTASELADAAARLNAGREGDAAAWRSAEDAGDTSADGATRGFPAPAKPKNPDADNATPAPTSLSASPRAATYADWFEVGAAVEAGTVGTKPTEQTVTWADGTTGTAYVINTPEQLAWIASRITDASSPAAGSPTEFRTANVQLGADIDLAGLDYTGKQAEGVGDRYANCLTWPGINGNLFDGRFDGAGYRISNVRIANADAGVYELGFFRSSNAATIERVGLASGHLEPHSDVYVGTIVGTPSTTSAGVIRNCYSFVDIGDGTATASAGGSGSLVGYQTKGTFEASYYAGTCNDPNITSATASWSKITVDRVYCDGDKNPDAVALNGATVLSTAQLQSDDTLNLLNGSNGVWGTDWQHRNGGYPVVMREGDLSAAPTSWEEVGKQLDTGGLDSLTKPAEQTVAWSDGSTGQAYVIDGPEQLAWFAYKVRTDNANYSDKNVQLAADIDLAGLDYSGATETGADFANCLKWAPIGVTEWELGNENHFRGHFDGAGYVVKNLRLACENSYTYGLFGSTSNARIERLGIASGCMSGTNGDYSATLVGNSTNLTLKNCFSAVDLKTSPDSGLVHGGLTASDGSGSVIERCYYAGTAAGSLDPVVVESHGTVSSCYYDKEKAPNGSSTTATPKTTAELKSRDTVALLNGSAATAVWDIDSKNRNSGYPVVLREGEPPAPTSWEEAGKQVEEGAASMPAKPTAQEVTWSGGGTGTAYVINNAEQLAWFSYMLRAKASELATQNVQLADNIDLAGLNYTGADAVADDYSDCLEWLPIAGGNSGTSYSGTFDGAGKVVRNLSVNQSGMKNLGLIGSASGATVQGVGLESGRLVGQGYLGGLIGYATGVVKVSDCWNAASIVRTGTSAYEHAGGLVGGNETAGSSSTHVEIARCYNKGSVYSADTAGDSALGGVAGYVPGYSVVSDCYNTGSVSGAHQTGGVVGGGGTGSSGSSNYTRVTNCYNTGIVERGGQANGAVAAWRSKLSNCYTLPGSTENQWEVPVAPTHVTEAQLKSWGAAYQLNGGDGVKAFADAKGTWRTDTAKVNDGYPVLCASGESLASASSWNDVGLWVDAFAPGNKPVNAGTLADPYLIGSEQQLAWWAYKMSAENATFTGSYVKLTADINLLGTAFNGQTAIGGNYGNCLLWSTASAFAGVFDGDGHTVYNLRMNRAFFSTVTGSVKNLTLGGGYNYGKEIAGFAHTLTGSGASLVNCVNKVSIVTYTNIYPNRSHFAGMVYRASAGALIDQCANEGALTISSYATASNYIGRVGGIVAELQGPSVVRNSYNAGALQANSAYLGGIAASMDASSMIENCFNVGSLTNRNSFVQFGDIVGTGSGTVKNCYASTTRSGDSTNADGTVKLKHLSTAQMQTRGFAVNLNGNTSGAGTAWTWTSGYPTFGEMTAVNWQDVGGFVYNDEGTFGSFKPTVGTGASDADAIELGTAEAMAYASYATSVKADDTAPGASLAWKGVCFKLADDIDLAAAYGGADTKWTGIGSSSKTFSGSFDGQGHVVRNMSGENSGLFGSFSGTARDARLEKSDVTSASFVGALAGNVFDAHIENCSVASDVTVRALANQAGGLVGVVRDTAFKDCWSRAAVKSDSGAAAGFVGWARSSSGPSSFVNCYSAPVSVEGATQSGVFGTGDSDAISTENCYWLSGTGLPAVAGGTVASGLSGKDELSMRSQAFALKLNATRTGDAAPWAWSPFKNGGYPALGKPPLDTELKTWGDVGARQTEDELKRTEVELDANGFYVAKAVHDALSSGGDYTPALEGTGALGDEYVVRTPEALAWFFYQVNNDNANFKTKNVRLGGPLDLSGTAYTSATAIASDFGNCLEWIPLGKDYNLHFDGAFDGGGFPIKNVRVVGKAGANTGFFGYLNEATVKRVMLASGVLDATTIAGGDGAGTFAGETSGGTVDDCASFMDIKGTADTTSTQSVYGAFAGFANYGTQYSSCYYAGSVAAGSPASAFVGGGLYGPRFTNCFYTGDGTSPYVTRIAADQLASWGAAYALNGGDGEKPLGDLKTWRAAKDTSNDGKLASDDENKGFPVLLTDAEVAAGEHITAAANWGDVGLWVDAFAIDKKPTGDGAATGSGTTGPFQIDSPEAFAWFAYKVNANAIANQNAVLVEGVDLAGNQYTGKRGTGTNFDACLPWDPIGAFDNSDGRTKSVFRSSFDGQGHEVSSLLLSASSRLTGGLFGYATTSSSIVRTGIASGAMVEVQCADTWGSLVGLSMGEVSDCFSRVDLTSSSTIYSPDTFGGLLGSVEGGSVSCCYYAGANPANKRCVGKVNGGSVGTDVYFAGASSDDANATALTQDQLVSWGAAYALNGGDGATALGDLNTWRVATDSNADGKLTSDDENGGFPVLVKDGDAVVGMQPASDWSDVGLWVDAFAPNKKPAEEPAPDGLMGIAPSHPVYTIRSAAQLAWFSYKVNTDNAEFGSKNVMLADNVDLFGETYTGKTFDASGSLNDQLNTNGLPWVPIGKADSLGDASRRFLGVLDGQNRVVRHLVTDPSAFSSGLFGRLDGQVSNIAIAASNVRAHYDDGYAAPIAARMEGNSSVRQCSVGQDVTVSGLAPGGVAGRIGNEDEATVTIVDCFSRADVQGKMLSGGIVSFAGKGVSIDSCYFAGTAKFAIADNTNSATKGANNYYQEGKPTQYSSSISATKLSAAEMTANKGSSLASKLNAGRTGKDAPWRGDSKGVNDAYPVLLLPADIMADWGEVGAQQSEDELRRTEVLDVDGFGTMGAVHDARPSGGNYVAALEGSGTEADPYIFRTPEAFAWWGYMVNEHSYDPTYDEAGAETGMTFGTSHAKQGANFDLSGFMYAGTDTVGTNHENCLMWDPISYYDSVSGSEIMYFGSFDGAGYRIENLRLVAMPNGVTGLFGDPNDGTIKRVTLSSGTLDVANMESYDDAGSIVGLSASITLRDCVSLVDVVGVPSAFRTIGGVIGYPYDSTVENCYYGGTIASGVPAKPVVDKPESAMSLANLFYLDGGIDDPSATGLTADQLASWGAAYQLNAPLSADGTQKAFGDLKTWRKAADGENNGFPVPCKDGESLGAASDWSDVGAWVDAFGTDDAADKAHPLRPQEKADHTWQDTTMGAAFELSSPEQLAWFAYKANSDSALMSKNVAITADIDLAGFEYTGKSDVEANNKYAGCLTWVPIGATAAYDKGFSAHFDGGGFLVRNIRIVDDSDTMNLGLFGYTTGAHIERVGLASGAMVLNACLAGTLAAGVEGANIGSAEYGLVEDCFSKVDVYDAPAAVDHMEQGGLIGNQCGAHVRNCYYAGTIEADLVLRYTVAMNEDGDFTNVLFAGRSDADDLVGDPIPADQLAGWGGAYQLNAPLYKDADGVQRQKPFADLGTWREDVENVNGGYPVLVRDADSDNLAHLRAAADWGEVGAWVDAFTNTKNPDYFPDYDGGMEPEKPAEIDAPASWGAPAGTKAYAIETPEDLAWFAYKVNTDNANFGTKSAVLSANVNLFGETYTGTAFNETADLNGQLMSALPWTPIGVASAGGDKKSFAGTFDGQGMAVEHLATAADTYYGGLFGDVQGAVRGTTVKSSDIQGQVYAGAIAAHLSGTSDKRASVETSSSAKDVTVRSSDSSSAAGGVVGHAGWSSAEAEVLNCFSRATVSGGAGKTAGVVGSAGYAEIKNSYFAGTAPRAVVGGSVGPVTSERTYYLEGSATDTAKPDGFGAQKLTDAELKSWRTAYKLNGDSFVGQEQTDGSTLAHTAWTVDDVATPVNDGYPVFGDLTVVEQDITLDPAKAVDSNDGTVSATLPTALVGKVELLETPDVSGLGDPAAGGAELVDPADVKAGFASWGTDSANGKLGLSVGTAAVTSASTAGDVLSSSGAADVSLNAAAAYNSAAERSVSFIAVNGAKAYRIAVTLPAVTSKTLDVTVPVEAAGGSFDVSPDGKAHTLGGGTGKEAAKAAAPSVLKNNGKVPLAGALSSAAPLPVSEASGISEALSPGTAPLTDSNDPVTDAGRTRLGVTTASGATGKNTVSPTITDPLFLQPGADGSPGSIPLYFAVQGSLEASDPNALAWSYFLEYSGTYLKDGTKFGFSTGYELYLPKGDVDEKALVSSSKLESGGPASVSSTSASTESGVE